MTRPTWDEYFLALAKTTALRAECTRRLVGALVVRDRRVVASGYNGAPAGRPSCLDGACPRAGSGITPGSSYDTGPGTCIAIHAEANALLYAGIDGARGSTLYLTTGPCDGCVKLIMAAGIIRVVWPEGQIHFGQ